MITEKNKKNKNVGILEESTDLIGEIKELTEDDIKFYHENILKKSKVLEEGYFDE